MIVTDEDGQTWDVLSDDPAWHIAAGLARRGFTDVTLPVGTIRYGTAPVESEDSILAILDHYSTATDEIRNALGSAFLAACQLYDCCLGAHELGLIKNEE